MAARRLGAALTTLAALLAEAPAHPRASTAIAQALARLEGN